MSTPILPFAVWQSGTNQNSIPANDNSLRNQILNGLVIGVVNDAPGGDSDGDIYVVGDTPAGDFAGFEEHDLAIFMAGAWYAYAPAPGVVVNIAGVLKRWDESTTTYVDVASGGGDNLSIITENSGFDVDPATHSGRHRLILAGGDVAFNVSEGYSTGNVFNIVATAALELLTTGVTLTPPAGGTLGLSSNMAVSIAMTSPTAGRVIGQTVPA